MSNQIGSPSYSAVASGMASNSGRNSPSSPRRSPSELAPATKALYKPVSSASRSLNNGDNVPSDTSKPPSRRKGNGRALDKISAKPISRTEGLSVGGETLSTNKNMERSANEEHTMPSKPVSTRSQVDSNANDTGRVSTEHAPRTKPMSRSKPASFVDNNAEKSDSEAGGEKKHHNKRKSKAKQKEKGRAESEAEQDENTSSKEKRKRKGKSVQREIKRVDAEIETDDEISEDDAAAKGVTSEQMKRLGNESNNRAHSAWQTKIEATVCKLEIGWGQIHLLNKEARDAVEIQEPYMLTQQWNEREASSDGVSKLWQGTSEGHNIHWMRPEHAVTIAVSGRDNIIGKPQASRLVEWGPNAKNAKVILVDGNHRLTMVRKYLLEKPLRELERAKKKQFTENARKGFRHEILNKSRWLARIIDLDRLEGMEQSKLKDAIKTRLSFNAVIVHNADTAYERMCNIRTKVIREEGNTLLKTLAQERKMLTGEKRKNVKSIGLFTDSTLMKAMCSLMQFPYWRSRGLYHTEDLYNSRQFASGIVSPMLIWFAKFYSYLSRPINNSGSFKTKTSYFEYIDQLDMLDNSARYELLDDEFFRGLDDQFLVHLASVIQGFGWGEKNLTTYEKNRRPQVDSDEEEDNLNDGTISILTIDYQRQYDKQYQPAVLKCVEDWISQRQDQLADSPDDLMALKYMPAKIKKFFDLDLSGKHRIPQAQWFDDKAGLPMVTPEWIKNLIGSLNDVEDVALYFLDFIDATSRAQIQRHRYPNQETVVGRIEKFCAKNYSSERDSSIITRRTVKPFLGARYTGLRELHQYLRLHPVPQFNRSDFPSDYSLEKLKDESLTDLQKDAVRLNNLLFTAHKRSLEGHEEPINPVLRRTFRNSCCDADFAAAISWMLFTTPERVWDWPIKKWEEKGFPYTVDLINCYTASRYIWKIMERSIDLKKFWNELVTVAPPEQIRLWPVLAQWELKDVSPMDDDFLHLAPLQRFAAEDVGIQTHKDMIKRANRMISDAAAICKVEVNGMMMMPDDVQGPLKDTIQRLSFYLLSQIAKFQSVSELKELPKKTSEELLNRLENMGLDISPLNLPKVSRAVWRQNNLPPSVDDVEKASRKRARISDIKPEPGPSKKRPRTSKSRTEQTEKSQEGRSSDEYHPPVVKTKKGSKQKKQRSADTSSAENEYQSKTKPPGQRNKRQHDDTQKAERQRKIGKGKEPVYKSASVVESEEEQGPPPPKYQRSNEGERVSRSNSSGASIIEPVDDVDHPDRSVQTENEDISQMNEGSVVDTESVDVTDGEQEQADRSLQAENEDLLQTNEGSVVDTEPVDGTDGEQEEIGEYSPVHAHNEASNDPQDVAPSSSANQSYIGVSFTAELTEADLQPLPEETEFSDLE